MMSLKCGCVGLMWCLWLSDDEVKVVGGMESMVL